MKSRKGLLGRSRLYLILDKQTAGKNSLSGIIKKFSKCGIDIVQLRDKTSGKELILREAHLLRKLLADTGILFIVNDHLDIARIVECDGVHLGQEDTSIEVARRILGRDKIIGISCHTLSQALDAQKSGADYLGIGPIFPTPTKPDYKPIGLGLIRKLKNKIKIPMFAIGDINQGNINKVLSSGVNRVALCRAILKAKNTFLAAKYFSQILH